MIDPNDITNFRRTRPQLEEFLLFAILVAGKTAQITAHCLDRLLTSARERLQKRRASPFTALRPFVAKDGMLAAMLYHHGIGCHQQKGRTITELLGRDLNLRTCSLEDLESIWGVGCKTARFFLLHSRPGVRVACLDVHILDYLAIRGNISLPRTTPTDPRKYWELEQMFLGFADQDQVSPAELDLRIWRDAQTAAERFAIAPIWGSLR